MLRTIDRYLLKQYLQVLVICFVSFTGLFIVIDAFGHLDHFVDYSAESGEGLFSTLLNYYSYRSLMIFDMLCGMLALTSAMFTITWIQRHNEMTALLAAGIPRLRVLRPIIVAALAISVVAVVFRETVIPRVRNELATDTRNLSGDRELPLQPRYDNLTDIRLGGEAVVMSTSTIRNVNFLLPQPLDRYGKQLTAAEAAYLPPEGERPGGYLLKGVTAPASLLTQSSLRLANEEPVVVTPADAPWLGADEVFVVSGVSFELLAGGAAWKDYASTPELVEELSNPSVELGAGVRVALHQRLLNPFKDATLLFLGLPLVVSGVNRNPFIAIGMCLAVTSAFYVATLGAQSLGSSGWIRPALAAWAPLLIFVPIAAAISDPLRR
ncbi:putative permease YjgP/YjgQ family protein [Posidoniimonas corsicana]|uniref:Putative permease YjgP/YjgQ family protein n=1 Tax=Posidoniimonas corsicana TaxID=1938618 RepID=A0A5C5VH48_9BACT|nr:LptF/LptG family permease [Posidoniimonas corsicana]TWT37936.1 putative permease YjgP/YjgQ family protein [Posidoniimonas corsicana]